MIAFNQQQNTECPFTGSLKPNVLGKVCICSLPLTLTPCPKSNPLQRSVSD